MFVGLSLAIALAKPAVIVNLMVMSWGTLAGVFLAPYVYGLFWRRTTRAGVWAGIATGLGRGVRAVPGVGRRTACRSRAPSRCSSRSSWSRW